MQNQNWTENLRKKIFRLAKKGVKYQEIADKFGVSESTISYQISIVKKMIEEKRKSNLRKKVNQLRKSGAAIDLSTMQIEKVQNGWNDKQRKLALSLWKRGAKYNELADAFGVTRGSIASQIHQARNQHTPGKKKTKTQEVDLSSIKVEKVVNGWNETQRQQAFELWKKGVKYADIAVLFGVSSGSVASQIYHSKRVLYGLQTRRQGRPRGVKKFEEKIVDISDMLQPIKRVNTSAEDILQKSNTHPQNLPAYVRDEFDKNMSLKYKVMDRLQDSRAVTRNGKHTRRMLEVYNYTDEKLSRTIRAILSKKTPEQLELPKIDTLIPQKKEELLFRQAILLEQQVYNIVRAEAISRSMSESEFISILVKKYARDSFPLKNSAVPTPQTEPVNAQQATAQNFRSVATELLRDIVGILKENNILPTNGVQS